MSDPETFRFRLYVAGGTQNSEMARANLVALCRDHLRGCYEVEIVDVLRDPDRALDDGIFMTPTTVRLTPLPVRTIVGTLNHSGAVLQALGVESVRL
jgi:KaiB domain.